MNYQQALSILLIDIQQVNNLKTEHSLSWY